MAVAIVLALAASLANALSSVLQRIGVQDAPAASAMRVGLLTYALRRGVWLAGLACIGAGFVLQAVALRFGQLTSVQPIVTTELLFLVLILGVWFRYRVSWRDWSAVVAAAGGLATFLVVARPDGGNRVPDLGSWAVTGAIVGGMVLAAVAAAATGPRWWRAAMYGTAGAVLFALSAALTKVFSTLVTEGWGHVFGHWEPYALVATGVLGLFLTQNAFHAGPVTASQAALTIVDPLVSVGIGILLFGERLHTSGWHVPAEVCAMAVMFAGVFVLSQSPLVAGAKDESRQGERLIRQHRPRVGDGSLSAGRRPARRRAPDGGRRSRAG